jgi:hypothetical protein
MIPDPARANAIYVTAILKEKGFCGAIILNDSHVCIRPAGHAPNDDCPTPDAPDPARAQTVEQLRNRLWDIAVEWSTAKMYDAGLKYLEFQDTLDALITALREAREQTKDEKTLARSDHPSVTSDPDLRGDDRG